MLKTTAESVLIPLGLTIAASVADAGTQSKILRSRSQNSRGFGLGTIRLIISNKTI